MFRFLNVPIMTLELNTLGYYVAFLFLCHLKWHLFTTDKSTFTKEPNKTAVHFNIVHIQHNHWEAINYFLQVISREQYNYLYTNQLPLWPKHVWIIGLQEIAQAYDIKTLWSKRTMTMPHSVFLGELLHSAQCSYHCI